MKKLFILNILSLFFINSIYSQKFNFELGFVAGLVSMQTDYGERGDFASSYGNIGYGIAGVYYISASHKKRRWNDRAMLGMDHFRLKAEISYMQTKLIHRGTYTQGTSEQTILYSALIGTSSIINYGLQFEYTVFRINDGKRINPYLSLGVLLNSNSPKLESALGTINNTNSNLIPNVYDNGVFLEKNNSSAITFGFGTRINSKNPYNNSKFLIDFRWQRFNSDIIEGLDPQIGANKDFDFLLFLNIGYVFSLN